MPFSQETSDGCVVLLVHERISRPSKSCKRGGFRKEVVTCPFESKDPQSKILKPTRCQSVTFLVEFLDPGVERWGFKPQSLA